MLELIDVVKASGCDSDKHSERNQGRDVFRHPRLEFLRFFSRPFIFRQVKQSTKIGFENVPCMPRRLGARLRRAKFQDFPSVVRIGPHGSHCFTVIT